MQGLAAVQGVGLVVGLTEGLAAGCGNPCCLIQPLLAVDPHSVLPGLHAHIQQYQITSRQTHAKLQILHLYFTFLS